MHKREEETERERERGTRNRTKDDFFIIFIKVKFETIQKNTYTHTQQHHNTNLDRHYLFDDVFPKNERTRSMEQNTLNRLTANSERSSLKPNVI